MATNADLLEALGDLKDRLGRMEGQLEGVLSEQQNSSTSRRNMYARLEEVNREVHRLSFTADAQAGIQAQTREVLKELADVQGKIARNVQPLLDMHPEIANMVTLYIDIRKARARWRWIATVFGGVLILLAGFMGEQIRQSIAAWLAQPPS
jgi:chromosome segregation ATPase